jgi:CheY-like chemotaxis protein
MGEPMDKTNNLRVAVCEDVKADAEMLAKMIAESDIAADVRIFESGEALLESFKPGMYDVIFLDIYMGGMRGIEVDQNCDHVQRRLYYKVSHVISVHKDIIKTPF